MRRILLSCAALTAWATLASANPLCTSNTMAFYVGTYVDVSTACQIGNQLFFGFGYSVTAAGTSGPSAAQVNVAGDTSDPNEPGIIFSSSGWNVSGTATFANPLYIDSNIRFTVATIGLLPTLSGATLDFTGQYSVSGQGVSNIGETIVLGSGPAAAALAVDSNAGPFKDVKTFAPISYLQVSKDLIVTVPRFPVITTSGSASISSFREGFTVVPEPVSIILFGSGLVGLTLLRRRRR